MLGAFKKQGGARVALLLLFLLAVAAAPETASAGDGTTTVLTQVGGVARWAALDRVAIVRAQPSRTAKKIATVSPITREYTSELFLALESLTKPNGEEWVRVRFPVLPNNRTGWVRRSVLGSYRIVRAHLVVDRARFTAILYRRGRRVFRSQVGVGQAQWPTPRGHFYIRNKLVGYFDPVYGPVAFGTSARSAVLTDWPGGGFIGIHGTNQPGILPGRVSHGCIRMPNRAIRKLARLMPVGTPLTIK